MFARVHGLRAPVSAWLELTLVIFRSVKADYDSLARVLQLCLLTGAVA